MGLEVCATSECKFLQDYLQNSQEWMLRSAANEKKSLQRQKGWRIMGNDEKVAAWKCKTLHREFAQETQELVDPEF